VTDAPLTVVWHAPLFDASGYAEDARNLILAADLAGVPVRANEASWRQVRVDLRPADDRRLRELLSTPVQAPAVHLLHTFPTHFHRAPGAPATIGRTMFETDRIPDPWVPKCNELDEIWVPCAFNAETFVRAGVRPDKVRVLPHAIDADLFRQPPAPLLRRTGLGFVFLSVFDWQYRKGWDSLLTAYCHEFGPAEDVTLVLKVHSSFGRSHEELKAAARALVAARLGLPPDHSPRIVFLDAHVPIVDMPRLYASADCFVLPTRGEGWCRPFMEAMACGVPVIGTRFGGHLDYMTDENSLLVDCTIVPVSAEGAREVPAFRGHRWAEPDADHLRASMRIAFTDRERIRALSARAREGILRTYARESVGAQAASLLARWGVVTTLAGCVPAPS
jgi:glycosyltransferase involved in cell wall biosynthesis